METRSEEQNRNWSWGEKNAEADDISYQIPSWKAIRRWLHSGALISLRYIAQALIENLLWRSGNLCIWWYQKSSKGKAS